MKLIKAVGLIDDLAAAVVRDELSGLSFSVVKRYIMRQDAIDAVEVVRCKDCKYWEHARQNKGICKPPSASHGGYCVRRGATVETDYCSYGERKGE